VCIWRYFFSSILLYSRFFTSSLLCSSLTVLSCPVWVQHGRHHLPNRSIWILLLPLVALPLILPLIISCKLWRYNTSHYKNTATLLLSLLLLYKQPVFPAITLAALKVSQRSTYGDRWCNILCRSDALPVTQPTVNVK